MTAFYMTWVYQKHRKLMGYLLLSALYAAWVVLFRLITLTLITYFSISESTRLPKFQDISDIFSSNQLGIMGLAACLFAILIHGFSPFSTVLPVASPSKWSGTQPSGTRRSEKLRFGILDRKNMEENFLPGFIQGCIFAGGLVSALLLTGHYHYLGSFIQAAEAPWEVASIFLKVIALASLVFFEEIIFRKQIALPASEIFPPHFTATLMGLIYCGIKYIQFDLGISQLFTLFLVSLALDYRARRNSSFAGSAGFWTGILILFHPILSLPILGNDFTGILLVKFQNPTPIVGSIDETPQITRILTGGVGGPLSGTIFQLLLLLDIGRSILRLRKNSGLISREKGILFQ